MEAIVLAGGLGTRLRSLVPNLPKPMAPMGAEPFLAYLLRHWIGQGVSRIVLALGYKHELVSSWFGAEFAGVPIAYSVEQSPLGTGGAVLAALTQLAAPEKTFLILNGDTFLNLSLPDFLAFHRKRNAHFSLAAHEPLAALSSHGQVAVGADEKWIGFSPPGEARLRRNGGMYLAEASAFHALPFARLQPFSLEQDFFPHLLRQPFACYAYPCSGRFFDMGTPEEYHKASKLDWLPRAQEQI